MIKSGLQHKLPPVLVQLNKLSEPVTNMIPVCLRWFLTSYAQKIVYYLYPRIS